MHLFSTHGFSLVDQLLKTLARARAAGLSEPEDRLLAKLTIRIGLSDLT
jgi:hypothetical protein